MSEKISMLVADSVLTSYQPLNWKNSSQWGSGTTLTEIFREFPLVAKAWKLTEGMQDFRFDKGHAEVVVGIGRKLCQLARLPSEDAEEVLISLVFHDTGYSQIVGIAELFQKIHSALTLKSMLSGQSQKITAFELRIKFTQTR